MSGRPSALLVAWLWAGVAGAVACDKVDYVEAKDWTPEALERQYCHDVKVIGILQSARRAKMQAGVWSPKESTADSDACYAQAMLYERILKNVHGRREPVCN